MAEKANHKLSPKSAQNQTKSSPLPPKLERFAKVTPKMHTYNVLTKVSFVSVSQIYLFVFEAARRTK